MTTFTLAQLATYLERTCGVSMETTPIISIDIKAGLEGVRVVDHEDGIVITDEL